MKIRLLIDPTWKYLNQHIFNSRSVWSVRRFWYLYKIQFLKRCWIQESPQKSRPYQ